MIDQRAGDDAAVGLIGVECARIPGPELQRRGGFPAMREPVQSFELLDPTIHAQLGQQAAPAHTLQLARVADQCEPPPVALGVRDDAVEGGRGEHAGFVHDQGRPGRQPELRQRCRSWARPVEHVVGKDATWWQMLDDLGVVSFRSHP